MARMKYKTRAYEYLVEKLFEKKKRPHGSPNRKKEDNIKIYLQEMKCEVVDWIYLPQAKDQEPIFCEKHSERSDFRKCQ